MGDAMLAGIVAAATVIIAIAAIKSYKIFLRSEFWVGTIVNIGYFYIMFLLLDNFIYSPRFIVISFGLTWIVLTYFFVNGEFIIKQKKYGDIPLLLVPFLMLYFFYVDANTTAFVSVLFLWAILFNHFKPVRVPVLFLLSVVTLGLFSTMLHNLLDGLDIVSDSSSNIDITDVSNANNMYSDVSRDLPTNSLNHTMSMEHIDKTTINHTVTDLSTFTYTGFPSIFDSAPGIPANQFCFDPNVLANASVANQPVTLFDPSGMQAMRLDNGIIFGADNSHIGEYEFNKAFDRNVFYDNNKDILFTVDSDGGYFDKDGISIGKLDKLGAADVFMDNQQNIAYKTVNGTIFNGNGEIVGSVKA